MMNAVKSAIKTKKMSMELVVSDILIPDDFFLKLCQLNPDYRFERKGKNELIIMPPTFTKTGNYNLHIAAKLYNWNEKTDLGVAFDSSTGFRLSDDSIYSPDVAWVEKNRWNALSQTQQEDEFAPICPDFVIEIRSKSDRLPKLQKKMQAWLKNGCLEAWLIDLSQQKVYVYQKNHPNPTIVDSFQIKISSPTLLPDFELDLAKLK